MHRYFINHLITQNNNFNTLYLKLETVRSNNYHRNSLSLERNRNKFPFFSIYFEDPRPTPDPNFISHGQVEISLIESMKRFKGYLEDLDTAYFRKYNTCTTVLDYLN